MNWLTASTDPPNVLQGAIHATLVVSEDPELRGLRRKERGIGTFGSVPDAHKREDSWADLADDLLVDGHRRPTHALQHDLHPDSFRPTLTLSPLDPP